MGKWAKHAGVLATAVAVVYMLVGAATASATSAGPYPNGTMFIADQDCACVWEVPPGGSPSVFEGVNESPQDVAVDATGNLYWTQQQNGTIDERTAAGTDLVLASGFSPWGIAVDGSGNVYFGSFGSGSNLAGLYEIPSGGSPKLLTSSFGVFTSLAVDGNGDVWGTGGSNLVVVPPGTSGEELSISGTEFDGVRLNSSNDLFASTANYDSAIEMTPGAVTATTLGSIGRYSEGVAVDGSGDVFVGAAASSYPYGKVYEITPGGSPSVYVSDIASTGGLALYPAQAPAQRASASITLSSPTSTNVTTETTVTLTATVPSGETGGVQFDDNGYPIGNATATSGGGATTTTQLPAGTHHITATYLGDAAHTPAISNELTFTSTAVTSTTVLSFPNGTTTPGDQQLSVNANVSGAGGVPTGSVTFYDGSINEGSAPVNSNGNAPIQFYAHPGTTKVYGVYSGDSTFDGSTSQQTTVTTTTPYTPTLSTMEREGRQTRSGAVRVTIKLTVIGVSFEPAPTGTVSADDGFTCGTLTPMAGKDRAKASCTDLVSSGTDEDVTLSFNTGDSNYDSATTSVYVSNGGGDEDKPATRRHLNH